MDKILNKIWYKELNLISLALYPFSILFYLTISLRKFLYSAGVFKTYKFKTPIIIIGNLTVGGTGKTPLTIWLCNYLNKKGLKVGIISSGYKSSNTKPQVVDERSSPRTHGDEAILIYNKTNSTVISGGNRIAATEKMEKEFSCDVIIHDDGLQHYALDRKLEILVIDGKRKYGNGLLLPAGPLRETKKRLALTDLVVLNDCDSQEISAIQINNDKILHSLSSKVTNLNKFSNTLIHLVTGIGSIENIKNELDKNKITYILHPYPDHHDFNGTEVEFNDNYPVFTTEKDFVKLKMYNKKIWILQLDIFPNKKFINTLNNLLTAKLKNED